MTVGEKAEELAFLAQCLSRHVAPDQLREFIEALVKEQGQARYERDSARSVVDYWERRALEAESAARQFFEAAALWGSFPPGGKETWVQEMVMRWPFLKEQQGG